MKITVGDIREILEHDYEIMSKGGYQKQDGYGYEEFSFESPLGEDFILTLWYEDNAEDFSQRLSEYAKDFNPESHAATWFNGGNTAPGTPKSLRCLLEDAEQIKARLVEAAAHIDYVVEHGRAPETAREMRDDLLDHIINYCISDNYNYEVIRNIYDEVAVESNPREDSFRVRFKGRIFEIAVRETE